MLSEGMTLPEIATATGRQRATVNTLIQRAYKKLGISRQADLVRLTFDDGGCARLAALTGSTPTAMSARQRLIDAALACLAAQEYHRVSVRVITKAARVTPGLLTYYFAGKDELMLEAYRQFNDEAWAVHLQAAADAAPRPGRQLKAFARSVLFFYATDRERTKIRVSFQELVISNAEMAAAQAENYDRFLQALGGWISELYADRGEKLTAAAVRKLAIGVNSVIEGILLRCVLNPSRITPDEALAIALDMIGARVGVSFAGRD